MVLLIIFVFYTYDGEIIMTSGHLDGLTQMYPNRILLLCPCVTSVAQVVCA